MPITIGRYIQKKGRYFLPPHRVSTAHAMCRLGKQSLVIEAYESIHPPTG